MTQSHFATTHWSLVLSAADPVSPQGQSALATLCETYWYPVYAFIRRQRKSAHEAEDLTQAFFTRVLEKNYLHDVSPDKGRFRTFLLVCLKRFLVNEWQHATAQKRGGGLKPLSFDFANAEQRFTLEPADTATPEQIFDRRWALTILETALAKLAAEMHSAGKSQLFETLKVFLVADASAPPHAHIAAQLHSTEGAVKVAVHRLRQRYAALLRHEVSGTLEKPTDTETELHQLLAALA